MATGGGRQSLAKRWPVLGPASGGGRLDAAAYALVKGDGVAATVFSGVALCLAVAGVHNHNERRRSL